MPHYALLRVDDGRWLMLAPSRDSVFGSGSQFGQDGNAPKHLARR